MGVILLLRNYNFLALVGFGFIYLGFGLLATAQKELIALCADKERKIVYVGYADKRPKKDKGVKCYLRYMTHKEWRVFKESLKIDP